MFGKYKSILTLIVSVLVATVVGMFRGGSDVDDNLEAYQLYRIRWHHEFDMVLAGDSRLNQGLSPATMRKILPDYRIANFGWGHAVFGGEYLKALDGLIDPESPRKVMVLGISPLALTKMGYVDNEYTENKRKHPIETFEQMFFKDFLYFFRPIEFQERSVLRIRGRLDRIKEFHPDGWAAATMKPEKPRVSLSFFKSHYSRFKVSDEVINELLSYVGNWQESGISVYGFMMPTSPAMIELEKVESGFNEKEFIEQFTEAGGKWIDVVTDKYHSYDGNHLRKDEAVKFSRVFARALSRSIKKDSRKTR